MRTRIVSLLLAAAGLFSTAAPILLAQGVIVTTLPTPLGISSDLFMIQYPIDLNGDGLTDFTFAADSSGIGLRTERANRLVVNLSPAPNIGGPVADLSEGFAISSSLAPQLAWLSSDPVGGYVSPGEIAFATIVQCLDTGCLSTWPAGPATRDFIGIEFELGDDLHYGYLDVMMSGDAPGGLLLGWAYETSPNTPIFAGAVPEPSTWTLLGLGIVMLAWRKRKLSGGRCPSGSAARRHARRANTADPGAYFHLLSSTDLVTWQTNAIVKAEGVTNSALVSATQPYEFYRLRRQ